MKHWPKKSEIMIKKINRIMQIFYIFRISFFRKTKMVWLDLFKELFYWLEQKMHLFQMFIRKIVSEKFPNDGKTIIWKKEFIAFIHL